jgi:REP element-mobilizing transposase RayT
MPKSRSYQVSLIDTLYCHYVSRCVRRAFLCGFDKYSGTSYEHRQAWVKDKVLWLSSVFAIGICAYAVMSNHVHLVLCVDKDKAMSWSDKQVVGRWHRLHRGTLLSQKFMRNELLSDGEGISLKETTAVYRQRLYDISWLMASLSEPIARQANKEDGCTGRFWEGRFKSQALLDDAAVLSCMAYVDLNPIRAKMAKALEFSQHTSIKKRTEAIQQHKRQPQKLLPFVGNSRQDMPQCIAFSLQNHCELVNTTGRIIRADKAGAIDSAHSPIPSRLGLSEEQWITLTTEFEQHFCYAAGAEKMMQAFKIHTHRKRIGGMRQAKRLLS